jgi:error-prone DNA polymerase
MFCYYSAGYPRGALSCDKLFAQAASLALDALAITDRASLAGSVRAHVAAEAAGIRAIIG